MFSLGWLPQLKKKFLFGCPFQLSEWQNKWPENCVPHLHCIQLCTWHHRSSKRDRITRRFFESFMSFYSSQTPSHYSLILLSTLFSKRKSRKNSTKKVFLPTVQKTKWRIYRNKSYLLCVKNGSEMNNALHVIASIVSLFRIMIYGPTQGTPKIPENAKNEYFGFLLKFFLLAKCLEICNYAKVKGMKLKQIWKFPSPPFTTLGIMLWIFNWPRVHKISRKVAFISLFVVLEGFT